MTACRLPSTAKSISIRTIVTAVRGAGTGYPKWMTGQPIIRRLSIRDVSLVTVQARAEAAGIPFPVQAKIRLM
ncbi:MAG: hypothetical protein K0S45_3000 [Nitrospira sp.]|nr:hypothetical protein [Nitrospira sp.]